MTRGPSRLTWDDYGLALAQAAALRADCTRRKVGAVLLRKDYSVVGTGYNGGPSKGPSCLAGECPRGRLTNAELAPDSAYDQGRGTCIALHAEWNLLLRTSWEDMTEAYLYITTDPCHICRNLIAGTKIHQVMWPSGRWYPNL